MSRAFEDPIAAHSFRLEFERSAPVDEIAFVEYAVIELVSVERQGLLGECVAAKDGHYDLHIGHRDSMLPQAVQQSTKRGQPSPLEQRE